MWRTAGTHRLKSEERKEDGWKRNKKRERDRRGKEIKAGGGRNELVDICAPQIKASVCRQLYQRQMALWWENRNVNLNRYIQRVGDNSRQSQKWD